MVFPIDESRTQPTQKEAETMENMRSFMRSNSSFQAKNITLRAGTGNKVDKNNFFERKYT